MASGGKRTNFRKQLNPAFAKAHGLAVKEEEPEVTIAVGAPPPRQQQQQQDDDDAPPPPTSKASFSVHRLEQILKRARATGKLNASNAGLTHPLPDKLFDLRLPVDLSLQNSSSGTTTGSNTNNTLGHAEETLTAIDLSDNSIDVMDDERFLKYVQAQSFRFKRAGFASWTLDLSSLSLEHQMLRILDLSGNQLETFDLNLLPNTSLVELHLQSNQLRTLTASSNNNTVFTNLAVLDLSDNRFEGNVSLQFAIFPKLTTFRCQKNRLTALPSFLDDSCRNTLQTLDASHNQLVTTNNNTLDFSKFTKLHSVLLGFNKLETIPCIHSNVQRLDLNANKLTTIEGLFSVKNDDNSNAQSSSSSSLIDILLQDNYIDQLAVDVIQKCTLVQRLDLSHNKLKTLPYQLGFLPQLQSLRLLGNPLLTFKASDIDNNNTRAILQVLRNRAPKSGNDDNNGNNSSSSSLLTSGMQRGGGHNLNLASSTPPLDLAVLVQDLKNSPQQAFDISGQLVLDGNRLDYIPDSLFPLVPNVSEISIANNLLTQISPSLGSSCRRLSRLSLSRNRLCDLSSLTTTAPSISWSQTLLRLDLSVNRLTDFPISILRQFVQLDTLNLSSNKLQSISSWNWLPSTLSVLDLSENHIDNVDTLVIVLGAYCPALTSLSLAYNDIRKLPYEIGLLVGDGDGDGGGTLKHLDLKGNPQQRIRQEILLKSCADQLKYFYNRMTREDREDAQERMKLKRLAGGGGGGGGGGGESHPPTTASATHTATSASKVEKQEQPTILPPPSTTASSPKDSTSLSMNNNRSSTTGNTVAQVGSPTTAPLQSGQGPSSLSSSTQEIKKNENQQPPPQEKETSSELMTELKLEINKFETELENLSLTQAKKYAVKKSLAMARSKLIREERRLGLRK